MDDRNPAGFTLIEFLITIAVLGIVLGIAVPAMKQFIERNRLVRAAEHVAADLHSAHSKALESPRRGTVYISFGKSGERWCYSLSRQTYCNCLASRSAGKAACAFRTVHSHDFPEIALTAARFSGTPKTFFESTRGTGKAGHVELRTAAGYGLQIRVSISGRVRICAPESGGMSGRYSTC